MYPELGRLVGYAVTCVYGLPDPNFTRLGFGDVIDALEASPQPTILVMEQNFPPEIANRGRPGRRQYGLGHEVHRLRGPHLQWPVA